MHQSSPTSKFRFLPNFKYRLRLIPVLLIVLTTGTACSLAVNQYLTHDDCAPLTEHPERWRELEAAWSEEQVVMVLRHASKCDIDTNPDCVNGNESLTPYGEYEALAIGEGVRQTLSGKYRVSYSYLDRTRDTALLAFGEAEVNEALQKPCKNSFDSYVANLQSNSNEILVTHSSCINALKQPDGDLLLGFGAGEDENFGIATFIKRSDDNEHHVIGCARPKDWAMLAKNISYPAFVNLINAEVAARF